ncbi:MAG TPA: tetratricopeptide repeat protein, partial [Thermoanaerobaculia bacterium]|nr:tetratricopeptide repeat protein [Thermoanaerobaculia bacterium]
MILFRRTALPCLLAAMSLLAARQPDQISIQGGETRVLTLEAEAGQYLGIVVEQDRIDLVIELLDPQGKTLATVDGPDYWMWEEEISLITEASGPYQLKIRPLDEKPAPGAYRVRIDGPREPRDADRLRLDALRAMASARAAGERVEDLDQAIRMWRTLGDRRREAEALHRAMEALGGLGRGAEAAERFDRAVQLWQELGLPMQQAWTVLESTRGDKGFFRGEKARLHMEDALKLARQAGSRFVEVRALHALGLFHEREPRTAVTYLQEAERLAPEAGVRSQQMSVLYQLGYTYDDLAEKQDALRCYEAALELSKELQNTETRVNTLNSLGHLYASLGHWEMAAEHLEQALELSEDARKKAAALNNLALVYENLDPAKARENYRLALDLGREAGDREIQAKAIGNLALLDLREGDACSALELSRGALSLTEGDPASESHLRYVMGRAWRLLGDLEASRKELQTALAISRERQDRAQSAKMIEQLARTEIKAGKLLRARDLLGEGIDLLESIRAEVVQEELRTTFLASRQDTYRLHIDTLMALHRAHPTGGYDAEALQASERARARTLLDILAQAAADVREGADPALIEKERRLLTEIEDLERRRLALLGKGA